jgi:transposase-like protein
MNEISRESSALSYLTSKESYIVPTAFERMAAKLKGSIARGSVSGISFPCDEVKAPRKDRRKQRSFTDSERIAIVKEVNADRKLGATMHGALEKHEVGDKLYSNWCQKFNMGFVKHDKKETARLDTLALGLIKCGMTITAACKQVGIRSDTFSVRTIQNGSRKAVKRMKMTTGHITQIDQVNALRGQGSTLRAALVTIGISEANYRRYSERMKFNQ